MKLYISASSKISNRILHRSDPIKTFSAENLSVCCKMVLFFSRIVYFVFSKHHFYAFLKFLGKTYAVLRHLFYSTVKGHPNLRTRRSVTGSPGLQPRAVSMDFSGRYICVCIYKYIHMFIHIYRYI